MALTKPLYDRDLWTPCRHTVAGGISIGLFFAMLPIPMQMLCAALSCMRARVNIPVAMAICWVSNPFTHPPLILVQLSFGQWIRSVVDLPLPFDQETHIHFMELNITGSPADFFVGCLSSAILLSVLAYPVVYAISGLLPIPQRRHKKHPNQSPNHK
jgi:uncharacterized protein (DUF2062 family)